jgi:methionyl-tRNA synthetase
MQQAVSSQLTSGYGRATQLDAASGFNFRGGGKFSKSRGTAVGVPQILSRYDPDALQQWSLRIPN